MSTKSSNGKNTTSNALDSTSIQKKDGSLTPNGKTRSSKKKQESSNEVYVLIDLPYDPGPLTIERIIKNIRSIVKSCRSQLSGD